ncbi:unnamed protein product [Soboliphyme baturini]|uniref:E3_UbLigase_R4 domain-containing protein n=1 Tax=Soboliphyme baturini TaxID=241478 RepID=A0A183I976_9BILA|nr:unnamed protein product [Soboliphyme baturini]
MVGNPYSSSDSEMGPLMRDIKNKICRDCELVSLLEDDTGMELLVNNKIISLDLPVMEVYRKIWQPLHTTEPMLIIYRMRGLLGDATEEFIETLEKGGSGKLNEEEVFRAAAVLSDIDAFSVMLSRLQHLKNLKAGHCLLTTLMMLFDYGVKIKRNRLHLIRSENATMPALLSCLTMVLSARDTELYPIAEKIINVLQRISSEANCLPEDEFVRFAGAVDTSAYVSFLLKFVKQPNIIAQTSLREALLKTATNICLGSKSRMDLLLCEFGPYCKFLQIESQKVAVTNQMEALCLLVKGIELSRFGAQLKDSFIAHGCVKNAIDYLSTTCPPLYKVGITIESPEWSEFISRPMLKFVLRFLTGLCHGHEPTQLLVASDCVPVIHRLEPVSSEEHLGTLAENLMESLRENPKVAKKIEEVREETRLKKKQMAMAMRQKQLGEMGMQVRTRCSHIIFNICISEIRTLFFYAEVIQSLGKSQTGRQRIKWSLIRNI